MGTEKIVHVRFPSGYEADWKEPLARIAEARGELCIVPPRPEDPPRTKKEAK